MFRSGKLPGFDGMSGQWNALEKVGVAVVFNETVDCVFCFGVSDVDCVVPLSCCGPVALSKLLKREGRAG